jgi:hypothetical protein
MSKLFAIIFIVLWVVDYTELDSEYHTYSFKHSILLHFCHFRLNRWWALLLNDPLWNKLMTTYQCDDRAFGELFLQFLFIIG